MKKVFNNKKINKVVLGLLGLVLSVMLVNSLSADGSKVLAASGDQILDTSTDFLTVEYTADDAKTKIGTSAPAQPTKSGYEDWLFAGWYKNIECTKPIRTANEATDTCYAKFVPTDVLSVKCQVLADTTAESEKTNMRFTTSIDTNQYWNVGFVISRDGKNYNYTTRFAYERIEASEASGVTVQYSPKVIDTKSEAFVTYTIKNIPNTDGNRYFDTVFMARPYWTTWDGVRVYGVTKYASVSDSYNNVVNIPVKVTGSSTAYTAENFGITETTYDSASGAATDTPIDGTDVSVRYNLNQNYAALVMTGKIGLSSATKYTITNNEEESTYIHRNLETKYAGAADTTWYYADSAEDEFVIATNADLYGLSYISKNASKLITTDTMFEGKSIYVISDIDANVGRATTTGWSTVEEDGETAIEDATSYEWYKVGTAGKPFAGTFDGQGHTISGISYTSGEARVGMFGQTASGSVIKDFKLTNSYFGTTLTSGDAYLGAIAGYGGGNFETIKSEAYINSGAGRNGGIVGNQGDGSIIDCWYSGTMTLGTNGKNSGGIVGMIGDSTVTMEHCLYSGTITGAGAGKNAAHGGLCGHLYGESTLNITDSLSVGSVTNTAASTSNWIGSVVGFLGNGSGTVPTISLSNTYVKDGICQSVIRRDGYAGTIYIDGTMIAVNTNQHRINATAYNKTKTIDELTGCDGYYNDTIALDFTNYWGPVVGGTPELLTFSDNALDVWEGKGTESLPWMIYTEEELKTLATLTTLSENPYNFTDKYVQLGADIMVVNADTLANLQKKATTNDNWKPIGSSTNPFAGTFDGDMKTISGLYYKGTDTYVGLFGCTANSSTVKNLQLSEACYFESENSNSTARIGSVAGCVQGTLDTVRSDATVVSVGHENGGIAGAVNYSGAASESVKEVKFTNVWFGGTLTMTTTVGRFSGGIIGKIQAPNRDIVVEHCLVTGTITATRTVSNSQLGGILGQANAYRKLVISDSLATSVVQNVNADTGAIIGQVSDTDSSYTLKDVYAVDGLASDEVTYDHAITGTTAGTLSSESENYGVLDVATINDYDGWYNTTLDFETNWSAISEDTPQLTCFKEGTALDTLTGKGQESSPWMINNAEDLKLLASLAESTYNFSEKYLELGATITVNDGTTNWTPIGTSANAFVGNFNGANKTISGLYYKGNGTNIGLFGYVGATGNISNVTLADSSFESTATGNTYIGGIVGYTGSANYTNIKVDDTVTLATTGSCVGGIAGMINWGDTVFDTCWSAATINMKGEAAQQVGGIVGRIYSGGANVVQMKHCLNTGNITSATTTKAPHAGGLCGVLQGSTIRLEISDSLNTNSIEKQYATSENVGTLIGTVNSGTLKLNQVYGIKGYELFGTNNGTLDTANSADYAALVADAMTSDASWLNMELDYVDYWYPVSDSTPELQAFPVSEELVTWEGEGTEESPWIFDTAEELKRFTQAAKTHAFEGEYVQLGTDAQAGTLEIAMNECESVDELKSSNPTNWTPIGNATTPFAGNFNGNGNTISGLYCTGSTAKAGLGLFGYTAAGSEIYDFTIEKSYLAYTGTGNAYLGSVSGAGAGQFTLIKSEAELESSGTYNGGIIGAIQANSDITNCSFAGSIALGTDKGQYAGGLVGIIENSAVVNATHCLNKGNLSGDRTTTTVIIGLSGLCAYVYSGTLHVEDTLRIGTISGTGNRIAHLISRFESGGTATFTNSYYGKISGITHGAWADKGSTTGVQGFDMAALKGDGGWLNTDLDFDTYWNPIVDSTPELQAFPSGTVVTMWDGEGTESSPWIIKSADELWRLTNASPYHNYENEFIKLGADIAINEGTLDEIKEASPKNWRPIGVSNKPFEGNFDGDGHTISGLYYKGNSNHIGLFAVTGNTSVIHNLKVKNSYFESTLDADATTVEETENVRIGSVAGVAYGTYENIKSDAEVVCYGMAGGGLVGMVHHYGTATFDDCWFAGTLYVQGAASHCGGLIGKINARNNTEDTPVKITNCLNSGTIVIDARNTNVARVGGICGSITSAQEVIITNCLNAKSFVTMRERCSSIIGTIEYTVAEGETAATTVTLTNVYAIKGLASDGTYNTDTVTFTEEIDGVETEVVNTYSMFHGYHADANMISINNCAILTEEQLAGANAVTNASSLFEADTNGVVHWAQGVLYPTLNMEGEVLTALPEMNASNNDSTTTTLSTGDRNMVTTVTKTTSAEYTTYLNALETAGFETYATNEIGTVENEKVISNTYTKDNLVLCANYFEKTDETTISYYEGTVSENLVYKESYVADNKADAKTTLHMLELFHYGNSFVIQLKNGHFIISDGGFEEDLPYLFDYLEDLAGDEKPVIEAWFITHAHGDHTGAFNALWGDREDHALIGRVYVNGVYYSSPSDVILEDPDCGAETLDYTLKRTVNLLRTESGEQTRLYRPQTGQRYYFNDTTIDILLAQEHLALDGSDGTRANLNSSSTVSLFTSDVGTTYAQTCLLSGDIEEAGYDVIFKNYEAGLFDVNFFTLNHHGFNTGVDIANMITADTVLLTVRDITPVRRATAIAHLISKAKESMAWGNGTVVFTLPHTASKETQNYVVLPSNEWIYHEGVERTIQPNLTEGTDTTADGTFY